MSGIEQPMCRVLTIVNIPLLLKMLISVNVFFTEPSSPAE